MDINHYVVSTRHGDNMTFYNEDDANTYAQSLVDGFKDGTKFNNHPMPTVFAVCKTKTFHD